MKKKSNDPNLPRLTHAQYCEWLLTIEQWNLAKEKLKTTELEREKIQKDSDLLRLKAQLYGPKLEVRKNDIEKCEKEYNRFKTQLEKDLGVSLQDCVIDDVTYEVKKL